MAKQIGGRQPVTVASGSVNAQNPTADRSVHGCNLTVNPNNGIAFLAWTRLTGDTTGVIQLSRSFNNGTSWDTPQNVTTFTRLPVTAGTSTTRSCSNAFGCVAGEQIANGITGFRVPSFAQMKMDSTNRIHLVYEDWNSISLVDIKYVQITNCNTQGQSCTFSSPVNVLNDMGAARDQFLPSISYYSTNNTVDITSLDRRNDPNNSFWQPLEYHCHLSSGSCTTASQWSTSTIVTQSSDNNSADPSFIGDYYQLTSRSVHEADPVWADSRQNSGTELGIWFNRSSQ
jgi:hypothetical protein